jgi:lysyl-tRNA synthetase class 1
MEAFLDAIIVDEPGQSLANIASAFLLRRDAPEDSVRRTAEHAPLLARITQEIMADDHVVAKVGSVEDDPFGRLFEQAKTSFQLNALWLDQAFRRLLEKHSLVLQHFAAWANRHYLSDDIGLLLNGIDAWLQSDYVNADFLVCRRRVMG